VISLPSTQGHFRPDPGAVNGTERSSSTEQREAAQRNREKQLNGTERSSSAEQREAVQRPREKQFNGTERSSSTAQREAVQQNREKQSRSLRNVCITFREHPFALRPMKLKKCPIAFIVCV
jgi:hypothetical protein